MQIILHLTDEEAERTIECEEENIREAYREVIRRIENVCCEHQIRYIEIEVRDGNKKVCSPPIQKD